MAEKYADFNGVDLGIDAPQGPIQPVELKPDTKIKFRCHKQIACFNACCKNIDITLTPYDILRLKKHLAIDSDQFLLQHAEPYEMDHHGMPGFKLGKKEKSTACQFLTDAGCSVYEHRPAACRYYPLGQMGMRRKGADNVSDIFFIVKEQHCLGHDEDRTVTVAEYRKEQGVDRYDEFNRAWREIVIKKRSAGPTVGKPSERSFQLFQMCSYELDHFRRFMNSASFKESIDLSDAEFATLNNDDEALLTFALRFLRQVLFGEHTIGYQAEAVAKRKSKGQERLAARRDAEVIKQRTLDPRDQKDVNNTHDGD